MARDILNEFGPDSPNVQKARANSGGVKHAKDVMNYKPPKGPTNINDPKTPGIHGDEACHCGTQGRH